MSSVFRRHRPQTSSESQPALPPPPEPPAPRAEPAPAAAVASAAASDQGGFTPTSDIDPFVGQMLLLLSDMAGLPRAPGDKPNASVRLLGLIPRPLGLGGRRGLLNQPGLAVAELRGGWIEATVGYNVSGSDLDNVNTQSDTIITRLLSRSVDLRREGVLQLRLAGTTDSESGGSPPTLRRVLTYTVLYEYRFFDTDGAASLIARIPIDSETDLGSLTHEQTVVTDWMVRWDDQGAAALEISPPPRGVLTVRGLSIVAYLPGGGPTGRVTQTVVQNGGTTNTPLGSLVDFLNLFQRDSTRPLTLVFPPLPLQPGETLELHDYQVGELLFASPIVLRGPGDVFRVSFSETSFPTNNTSVVYLRALI
ncbi:MAG: hypothetical protein U0822_24165 [Anaerolineae bacterium]